LDVVVGNGQAQPAYEGEKIGVAAHVFELGAFGVLRGLGGLLLLLSCGAGWQGEEETEGEIDD
jgi:hypothetical protein